jgi:hypothetical protein
LQDPEKKRAKENHYSKAVPTSQNPGNDALFLQKSSLRCNSKPGPARRNEAEKQAQLYDWLQPSFEKRLFGKRQFSYAARNEKNQIQNSGLF